MSDIPDTAHTRPVEEVLSALDASQKGFSREEAEKRLEHYGRNTLPKQKQQHPFIKFLSHFHNPLIYVLIVAAAGTALLGHWIDTWIIAAVVVINAVIGYVQEGKAEKALQAVEGMLSLHARVIRDGDLRQIDASRLVPGDIVLLSAGDKVPADLRLLEAQNLKVNEASLTGESEPVEKQTDPVDAHASLGDRTCMAYSGTLVSSGQGKAVVCATGRRTEIGKINKMLSEVEALATPLLRQVSKFSLKLTAVILAIGAATLLIGLFAAGMEPVELFLAVVGIAVASIPEGLPAIMTVTLAIGVQRMARRKAVIRKLPGVETLGSVTVICSDKTGTLTKSEMTVTTLSMPERSYTISGTGYAPEGEFRREDTHESVSPETDAPLRHLLAAGVLCNDARLRDTSEGWIVEGNPTEGALLSAAGKAEIWAHDLHRRLPRVAVLPFSSEYKFMATGHTLKEGSLPLTEKMDAVLYLKGAPEVLFERCTHELTPAGEIRDFSRDFWDDEAQRLARQGQRVLAFARRELPEHSSSSLQPEDAGRELTFLGIAGIIDPPREEAIRSVKLCRDAGIRVKMITGDHGLTASSIAQQLGIGGGEAAVTGNDLDKLSDEELLETVKRSDVFARVTPGHKLRLVSALQNNKETVAMTGDGVNDAPALKQADIGIAMGIKGTEAAKEASEMVLTDDNFASIANAVEEGRTVYDNLKKSLLFILPTNGGEALIIITAILFGFALPITPAQILWVNMVTAVTLALALAFEPMETDVMKRPPRDPGESLVPGTLLVRILFVSLLLMAASFGLFVWARETGGDLALARTLSVNMLVFGEIVYLFNSRLITSASLSRRGIRATKHVWAAVLGVLVLQILFTYLPVLNRIFDTAGISGFHWVLIIGCALLLFLFVEGEKAFYRNLMKKKRNRML